MNLLFYLVGLLIGVAFFLYMLSLYHTGKDKISEILSSDRRKNSPENNVDIEPDSISGGDGQVYPRERICPLCGAVLQKYEALFASRFETENSSRILIYGCRYCYRSDNDS